ncbi:MAG: chromosomal replication initiator protein DnaA [Culicoidibacterales bacterium]
MNKYAELTWSNLINSLLEDQIITTMSYENWFKNSIAIDMDSKTLTIETEDAFSMNWIQDNYKLILENKLKDLLGQTITIHFVKESLLKDEIPPLIVVDNSPNNPEIINSNQSPEAPIIYDRELLHKNSHLNSKLTFDNFVSGSSNQLAYNIAQAISQSPGTSYNPMFLYGGSGLGKTHLIQAIGNQIIDTNPTKKVLYVTSEAFLSDYVTSIRSKNTSEFRDKYRKIDVLIIDDIQFFVGKEGIQEEFFHTFNHLHQLNKQIIITSDSQPNELTTLTERLRSRFSWGILTDIQPPELETRMAILQKKIDSFSSDEEVPQEVISYIASNIDTNVRDLEGALNGLFAHAVMLGKLDITLDLAVESLRSYTRKDNQKVSISRIQKIVSKYFHIPTEELKSKSRKEPLTTQRHISIYLCKKLTPNSLQKIGKQFGNRDHTTVMNSIKKIDSLLKKDPDLQAVIEELEKMIQF